MAASMRQSQRRSRKTHPLAFDKRYTPHPWDDYVLRDLAKGDCVDADLMLDPDFDGQNGVLYICWTDEDVTLILRTIFERSLTLLRDAKSHTERFYEALEGVCSAEFETYCRAFGYDADLVRAQLLRLFKRQNREFKGKTARLIDGLTRYISSLELNLTSLERLARY